MCLYINEVQKMSTKTKNSVDIVVDTAALEPRGLQRCQRCQRKKTYIHIHMMHDRGVCNDIYIYLCLHIIIIIVDHCWRGFPCQQSCQQKSEILLTFAKRIENQRIRCQQN